MLLMLAALPPGAFVFHSGVMSHRAPGTSLVPGELPQLPGISFFIAGALEAHHGHAAIDWAIFVGPEGVMSHRVQEH